jgi:hypothetical protein
VGCATLGTFLFTFLWCHLATSSTFSVSCPLGFSFVADSHYFTQGAGAAEGVNMGYTDPCSLASVGSELHP